LYTVRPYNPTDFDAWNTFVAESKNGTFLFNRNFMEYHADRFTDFSLMVFEGQKLVALLPANRLGDVVHSHQGLTYGGLVLKGSPGLKKAEQLFTAVCQYLSGQGIRQLNVKQQPVIYHTEPAHELDYLLVKNNAKLYRRDMNLAVPLQQDYVINPAKRKKYRQSVQSGMEIKADNDFDAFWGGVLIPRLLEKHNAKPVHTAAEIKLLQSRFPENIIQYNVYFESQIMAGITLFIGNGVVKSQYGATTPAGEKHRALDYLFITLIEEYKQSMLFFDMGVVTEPNGGYNPGLLKQKEELGCRVYVQDFYEMEITAAL
jgi:hypothetical protein